MIAVSFQRNIFDISAIRVAKSQDTLDLDRCVTLRNTATAMYCVVVVVIFGSTIAAGRTPDLHQSYVSSMGCCRPNRFTFYKRFFSYCAKETIHRGWNFPKVDCVLGSHDNRPHSDACMMRTTHMCVGLEYQVHMLHR